MEAVMSLPWPRDDTKQWAESILSTLKDGTVQLTPVSAFPMMNTSIVVGYRPDIKKLIKEEICGMI